jgi:hypothetical protein
MTKNGPPVYRVGRGPIAQRQMAQLMKRATEIGIGAEVAATLRAIGRFLQTQADTWGDPQYHTKLPGGVVLRAMVDPFIVKYALFEAEKAVLLLEVRAMPDHPLAFG